MDNIAAALVFVGGVYPLIDFCNAQRANTWVYYTPVLVFLACVGVCLAIHCTLERNVRTQVRTHRHMYLLLFVRIGVLPASLPGLLPYWRLTAAVTSIADPVFTGGLESSPSWLQAAL